ncbi:MAG: heme ABC exporter ATP-binding protein CcmA [Ruminococcaceae bacterium]|nr:heme ABC exporter ATP-binding protein CcmA [Oscillospiraceae bacterium]
MTGEIRDIQKSYGKTTVLRGVTFSAERGEAVALVGANGSGKSTLLRVLAGVLSSQGGEFLWDGVDLLRSRPALGRTVAYVPQGTPLLEELSALDNLRLWYERDALAASLDGGMLRELGVQDFLKKPVSRLSGGMRKRLSIGCAISRDPQVLLLDEPTAALDLAARERLLDYFAAYCARGGTILLATHDLRELAFCARCCLLSGGVVSPYEYDGDARRLAQALERS